MIAVAPGKDLRLDLLRAQLVPLDELAVGLPQLQEQLLPLALRVVQLLLGKMLSLPESARSVSISSINPFTAFRSSATSPSASP